METLLEEIASSRFTSLAPEPTALVQLLFGKHITYGISALARLGVPDHMSQVEAISTVSLATKVGAHQPSLYRLMRMLTCVGVFEESTPGSFMLTPVGELLKSDVPCSMRHFAIQFGDKWSTRAMEHFTETIRTGIDSVTLAFGRNVFDYFATEPEQAETFNRSMSNLSAALIQPIVDNYDFSSVGRLADVGGGHGTLLAAILERNPAMQGVVYDLPNVVSGALGQPHLATVAERIAFESGSFFERAPSGCDAYILKFILHDWSDSGCRKILQAIRRQLPADGRVLICEQLIGGDNSPFSAKFLDVEMLAMTEGGRERTVEEFSALFAASGLHLERVVPTGSPLFILEARPC